MQQNTTQFVFRKASKKNKKLKALLSASSGSGKTLGALLIAKGLASSMDKVFVIDTEKGSSELYDHLGEFNVLELNPPFTPEVFIQGIKAAESMGAEVIIVDSITHEWSGEGGCLAIHADLGGEFKHWAKVTPRHNAFIDAILRSKAHVLSTVRRKEEYTMVQVGGSTKVQKMGLQEMTRDGFGYEMDLVLEITNHNHLAVSTKDRTGLFDGRPDFMINEDIGRELKQWSESGVSEEVVLLEEALNAVRNVEVLSELGEVFKKYPSLAKNEDLIMACTKRKQIILDKTNQST